MSKTDGILPNFDNWGRPQLALSAALCERSPKCHISTLLQPFWTSMAPNNAKFHGESDGKGPEARNGPKESKNQKIGFEIFSGGVPAGPVGPPGPPWTWGPNGPREKLRIQIFDVWPLLGHFGPRDPSHRIPREIWCILVP